MTDPSTPPLAGGSSAGGIFTDLIRLSSDMTQALIAELLPAVPAALPEALTDPEDAAHWAGVAAQLQTMWLNYQSGQALKLVAQVPTDPAYWLAHMEQWYRQLPLVQGEVQQRLWEDGQTLWQCFLGASDHLAIPPLSQQPPKSSNSGVKASMDKRFAAAPWREQPFYAMLVQTYLTIAEQVMNMADSVEGLDPARKQQLHFAARTLVDAFSPDHFPLTNPLVVERTIETRGESLIKGMEHLIHDLQSGQLTQTDKSAFKVGENIAITPGKVVYETRLFQLIQYTPVTDKVLEVPLVIFPPWINRFYILDLNPKKSMVRWAVEAGISTFMVSWKSADATFADVEWDDYIAAQIEVIDVLRARFKVPAVHVVGYCVAGTTLAATLAILARRGEADKVASATFFTAQVDFEKSGDLKLFVDDDQLAAIENLEQDGYLDGRYVAATFNLLRGNDLIWSYVVDNYLLGQDYRPFDLLFWNSDSTNLPARWHRSYLRDLYRDNRLVIPDSLSALGTPIDLTGIVTPCYIQAGREDHIAPAESVWRVTNYLPHADWTFVLAGSGHIAGVVNPPVAGKYQYWTNPAKLDSLADFIAGAEEHKGSWWPNWLDWLRQRDGTEVPAKGKRNPGGRGDKVIEDAPGRYVMSR